MSRMDDYNYFNDSRTIAGMAGPSRFRVAGGGVTVKFEADLLDCLDEDDAKDRVLIAALVKALDGKDEVTLTLPSKFEVCGECQGKGSHVNPSIDAGGLTREDLYEDPDFAEAYFGGVYDVTCYTCGGERVTPEVDRKALPAGVLALVELAEEQDRDSYEFARECAAERAMGA